MPYTIYEREIIQDWILTQLNNNDNVNVDIFSKDSLSIIWSNDDAIEVTIKCPYSVNTSLLTAQGKQLFNNQGYVIESSLISHVNSVLRDQSFNANNSGKKMNFGPVDGSFKSNGYYQNITFSFSKPKNIINNINVSVNSINSKIKNTHIKEAKPNRNNEFKTIANDIIRTELLAAKINLHRINVLTLIANKRINPGYVIYNRKNPGYIYHDDINDTDWFISEKGVYCLNMPLDMLLAINAGCSLVPSIKSTQQEFESAFESIDAQERDQVLKIAVTYISTMQSANPFFKAYFLKYADNPKQLSAFSDNTWSWMKKLAGTEPEIKTVFFKYLNREVADMNAYVASFLLENISAWTPEQITDKFAAVLKASNSNISYNYTWAAGSEIIFIEQCAKLSGRNENLIPLKYKNSVKLQKKLSDKQSDLVEQIKFLAQGINDKNKAANESILNSEAVLVEKTIQQIMPNELSEEVNKEELFGALRNLLISIPTHTSYFKNFISHTIYFCLNNADANKQSINFQGLWSYALSSINESINLEHFKKLIPESCNNMQLVKIAASSLGYLTFTQAKELCQYLGNPNENIFPVDPKTNVVGFNFLLFYFAQILAGVAFNTASLSKFKWVFYNKLGIADQELIISQLSKPNNQDWNVDVFLLEYYLITNRVDDSIILIRKYLSNNSEKLIPTLALVAQLNITIDSRIVTVLQQDPGFITNLMGLKSSNGRLLPVEDQKLVTLLFNGLSSDRKQNIFNTLSSTNNNHADFICVNGLFLRSLFTDNEKYIFDNAYVKAYKNCKARFPASLDTQIIDSYINPNSFNNLSKDNMSYVLGEHINKQTTVANFPTIKQLAKDYLNSWTFTKSEESRQLATEIVKFFEGCSEHNLSPQEKLELHSIMKDYMGNQNDNGAKRLYTSLHAEYWKLNANLQHVLPLYPEYCKKDEDHVAKDAAYAIIQVMKAYLDGANYFWRRASIASKEFAQSIIDISNDVSVSDKNVMILNTYRDYRKKSLGDTLKLSCDELEKDKAVSKLGA
jgi:hypothetical protein